MDLEYVHKLVKLHEAIKAMRKNVTWYGPDAIGDMHHGWFTVAPCDYGEAVDDALLDLEQR